MSTPRRFMVADSFEHAELLDGLLCAFLCDVDGNHGSRWSGVYSDATETRFGIVYPEPFHDLYDTEAEIVTAVQDENGEWDWQEVPPTEPGAAES